MKLQALWLFCIAGIVVISAKNYEISMTVGAEGTNGNIWFRIQGNLSNSWTEWFSNDDFGDDQTITWDVSLTDVGTAQQIIVLSKSTDDVDVEAISGNDSTYTLPSPITLEVGK